MAQTIVEPTRDGLDGWQTPAHIFAWANIPGDLLYAPSMAGSLLMGLAGSGLLEYEEFGSILLSDVEESITGQDWRYSLRISAPIPDATGDTEISEETSTRPHPRRIGYVSIRPIRK